MTKTQPNRTTIFIMNLWVNRVRQLTILAVALFFSSCVDETNLIGFKPPNSKFDVKYVEIPLDSSLVFLTDEIYTENNGATGETNRLLVGVYDDPAFGKMKSIAYAEYYPLSKDSIKSFAEYDELELFLHFDYYVYGEGGITDETYSIHELTDSLPGNISYYNNTTFPYNPTPLVTKDTVVSYTYFQEQAGKSTGKDTVTIRMKLSDELGQRIFNFIKDEREDFLNDTTARAFFKGLVIVPGDDNKKMVGFSPNGMLQGSNPTATFSKMTLRYHEDTVKKALNFVFYGSVIVDAKKNLRRQIRSFNNIKADRSGSAELSGHQPYTPFTPTDDLLYSQEGDGVVTSINFGNFYQFITDSIKDGPIIINSGELVIDGVEQNNTLTPINAFTLRALEDDYHFKTNKNLKDTTDLILYQLSTGIPTLDPQFNVLADLGSAMIIPYKENVYKNHLTLFLQELSKKEDSKTRFRNFGLFPVSPQRGKSVNRTLINRNNIKLRIYYTLPTVTD